MSKLLNEVLKGKSIRTALIEKTDDKDWFYMPDEGYVKFLTSSQAETLLDKMKSLKPIGFTAPEGITAKDMINDYAKKGRGFGNEKESVWLALASRHGQPESKPWTVAAEGAMLRDRVEKIIG